MQTLNLYFAEMNILLPDQYTEIPHDHPDIISWYTIMYLSRLMVELIFDNVLVFFCRCILTDDH